MKITQFCIENRVTTFVLAAMLIVGGLTSFSTMGRLEDPEFTIKDAVIVTTYPGATAAEVEEEVTDRLETAIQKLGQLYEIESKSSRGVSSITATIKDQYDKNTLPQVWDELRRKVGDEQGQLPPGAGPSIVNDDFGDVYGVYAAVYGDEFTHAELWEIVKFLRRELLLVQDVAKIAVFGRAPEVVYVELDRDRMSQLGIPTDTVIRELRQKNAVALSGRVQVGPDFITIDPTGLVQTVEDLEKILISGSAGGAQIFLRDIATVRRDYQDPPQNILRYDGHRAIGLGISTVSGGNVVTMGDALGVRMQELRGEIPLGIEFGIISLQSDAVTTAIDGFVVSLLQAIAIVVVVLLFFMGIRSGLLIGFILFLTIAGSFVLMKAADVTLERISLGALIIALGMLVDNAIVIVDGMLIKLQQGVERIKGAIEVVNQNAIPLLGATVIAVLAFAAIGTSQDATGEYTRSLYTVILMSLMLSWLTAVTVTPLLGIMFLKAPPAGEATKDPYAGMFYQVFGRFLSSAIRFRWLTLLVVIGVFTAAVIGFGSVKQSFFPNSTRAQFLIHYWLPQGAHIDETEERMAEIEPYLLGVDRVTHVTSVVGEGGLRFLLTYSPEKQNSSYGVFLVDIDDHNFVDEVMNEVQAKLEANVTDAQVYVQKFILGPGEPGKVRARFFGPERNVLRDLASQAEAIMHSHPNAFGIRTDWRQRVKVVRPVIAEEQANQNGITRADIANALLQGFQGAPVGIYRERDELLDIVLRAPEEMRMEVSQINNLQIWSPAAQRMIPLRQVVLDFETTFEDEMIWRMNRKRAITVFADPRVGEASTILKFVRPQIEAIELPPGYSLEWWGEYRDSNKATESLAGSIPLFVVLMVLITVGLFNSLKQTAVIWLVVPLAVIGVTVGLLSTDQPFGFMALLGFMSLSGMLIKNAIVLIEQINIESRAGKDTFAAIIDSAISRLRPVGMAAATTILGMTPLFPDAFFVSLAVTVAFGLGFATVLTMVVVPVLYAIFYRAKAPSQA